jgi:hypothetical protein
MLCKTKVKIHLLSSLGPFEQYLAVFLCGYFVALILEPRLPERFRTKLVVFHHKII